MDCQGIGKTAVWVEMPKEDENKLSFQNYHKQMWAPYIIYADFEALTKKIEGLQLDPAGSNTQKTQHQEACSYCYIVVRCDGRTEPPMEYRGPSAAEHFLKALLKEKTYLLETLREKKPLKMTKKDWDAHRAAKGCYTCDRPLIWPKYRDGIDVHHPHAYFSYVTVDTL